jgi:hypothetical protein
MKSTHFLLGIGAVSALAAFAVGPRQVAAAMPQPNPTPVALQYDEISRMIVPPATPPAPGSFADDYQVAMNSATAATPTPAPRKHGLAALTNAIGSMESGTMAGVSNGMMGMMGEMQDLMRTGRVMRYTFYYTKGWIREDDLAAQTATISKCRENQFITLNLAAKTYTVASTAPKAGNCFNMPTSTNTAPQAAAPKQQPGTEDLTLEAKSQNLGSRSIDGIATTGSSTDFKMAATNATGSCRNGEFGFAVVRYVSGITPPRAYCPLPIPPPITTNPVHAAAQGGCTPTLHGQMNVSLDQIAANKLDLYSLMTMHAANDSGGRAMGMLTERGHVAWLRAQQADPLFTIPPGFTQSQ